MFSKWVLLLHAWFYSLVGTALLEFVGLVQLQATSVFPGTRRAVRDHWYHPIVSLTLKDLFSASLPLIDSSSLGVVESPLISTNSICGSWRGEFSMSSSWLPFYVPFKCNVLSAVGWLFRVGRLGDDPDFRDIQNMVDTLESGEVSDPHWWLYIHLYIIRRSLISWRIIYAITTKNICDYHVHFRTVFCSSKFPPESGFFGGKFELQKSLAKMLGIHPRLLKTLCKRAEASCLRFLLALLEVIRASFRSIPLYLLLLRMNRQTVLLFKPFICMS